MTTQAVVNKQALWDIGQTVAAGLGPHYQAVMNGEIQRELQNAFFPIFLAKGFAPEPFSATKWNALFPYVNIKNHRTNLKNFAERGFLKSVGDDTYEITDKGHQAIETVFAVAHEAIENIQALDDADMERLAGYLKRIVDATVASPEPAVSYAIEGSRWTDPGKQAAAIARVDQYLTDLGRYRDDAHIAAFASYGVPAHAWEGFSFIWRGEQDTPDALVERLAFRGHDAESYRNGLDGLVSMGWLNKSGESYAITDEGKAIRQAAEEETDRFFYIGWSALSESELSEMGDLLAEMGDNVARLTAGKTNELLNEVGGNFFRAINDDRAVVINELGLGGSWFNLFTAYSVDPDGFTAQDLQQRGPYISLAQYQQFVDDLVASGVLEKIGDGKVKVSDKGHQAVKKILKATWESFAKADILNDDQLNQLLGLMRKISTEIIEGDVANNAFVSGYDNLAPPDDEIPLVLVDHQSDLIRLYRDDAHHAVWQDLGVAPHAFEAFTLIWRGDHDTADSIAKQNAGRGYSADEYAAGLKDIVKRRWLTESSGKYTITDEGQRVRDEAEIQTDENYYKPWMVLSLAEQTQLYNLMFQVRNASKTYAEKVLVAARNDLYNKLQNCVGKFFPLYTDKIAEVFENSGLRNVQGALATLHWAVYEDEAFSSHLLAPRFPYNNPQNFDNFINNTLEAGFLDKKGKGYVASDKGREAKRIVDEAFHKALGEIGDKVETDLGRVYELLNKAMTACLNSTDDPPGTQWITLSKSGNPGDVSLTGKLDHIYDNFNAFRDDAHLATWKDHGVDGPTWESLTKIFQGEQISSGADLLEKMQFRGNTEEDYGQALETLVEKGWIELKDGKYVMTESGQTMRDEVERLTDLYFFRPWFVLNNNEVQELRGLLEAWESELQAMVDAKEAANA
jgi:predicted transcriptional regulator